MAEKKTKKNASIQGIGKNPHDKLIVQKSNPMTVLARSDLSLAELKILDMYLARINTYTPEMRTIRLDKGELEKALGVTQIKKDDLKERLKKLYQPIDLAKDDKKRLHLISLFEEASAEQDENGTWQITLTCTQSAMKYMFYINNQGFFRYKLSSIVSLKSRYSLLLYLYLEKNRFRNPWEVSLKDLKHELNCEKDEAYKEFKIFNNRILKRCQKELHEKTDIRYTYEPIKKGRSVVAVRFTLETLPKLCIENELNEQYTLESTEQTDRNDICNGFSHSIFDSFSDEELRILKELAWSKKRDSDVDRHNELIHDINLACEFAVTDFLKEKIVIAKSKKPKNLFAYVKKIVENSK